MTYSLGIQYLGSTGEVLDIKLSERSILRHAFIPGETYDVTNLATVDELMKNSSFRAVIDAGRFALVDDTTTGGDLGAGAVASAANIADGIITLAKMAASASGAAAGTPSLRAIGSTATTVLAGNDARMTDTRTPSAASVVGSTIGIVEAAGQSPLIVITKTFAAGAGGSADDVTIFSANAPYAFQIVDSFIYVTTGIALSTATLRSATAGGGSAKSDAYVTTTPGVFRLLTLSALPSSIAANGTLVLRRSDNGVAGTIVMLIQKV